MLAHLLLLLHQLQDGLQMPHQLFMILFGRPLPSFQTLSIKFKALVFTPSPLVMTIKLQSSTKPNKLLDHRVISNNTGTGHIKRLQLNGTETEQVAQITLPTAALKFNRLSQSDGSQLLTLFQWPTLLKLKLELDGLNSLDANLMTQMSLLKLTFLMLHRPIANSLLPLCQVSLEIVWTPKKNI